MGRHSLEKTKLQIAISSIWMPRTTRCMGARRRLFHGCYDSYGYLPLYVSAGSLLAAELRSSDINASQGSAAEMEWISGKSAGANRTALTTCSGLSTGVQT